MVLPLVVSIFLFLGFLYLTITDRGQGEEKMDKESAVLLILTLSLAVVYVLLHSILGFILSSVILLYTLLNAYQGVGKEKLGMKSHILGGLVTAIATVAVYSIFRYMTRTLLRMGRSGALPKVFGSSNMTAFLSLIVVTAFILLFVFLVYKKNKESKYSRIILSGIITFSVVLFLYIVFKQFFMVALSQGIVTW